MLFLSFCSSEAAAFSQRLQHRELHERWIRRWPGQWYGCWSGRMQRRWRRSHGNRDSRRSTGGPQQPQQHWQNELHEQATDRTRERIPLQQVPDKGKKNRDCFCSTTERDTSKNMVSES